MERTYILKHKNISVFPCVFDDETNRVMKLGKIEVPELIPVGVHSINHFIDKKSFVRWLNDRQIPNTRYGLKEFLSSVGVDDSNELMLINLGINMTDHYWLCPEDLDLKWEALNFYQNDFAKSIKSVKVVDEVTQESNMNPAYTTSGNLEKIWVIEDGKRKLFKKGSHNYLQEPFNEVFVSEMHSLNGFSNYVPYGLRLIDNTPYSFCESFIDVKTEFISAKSIIDSSKKDNQISYFHHFLNLCRENGLDTIVDEVGYMLATDYIIGNSDRHTNNFGIIRDADTLEWLKPAPIFDSGNSLWFDLSTARIDITADIKCNSFYQTQDLMLKHIPSVPEEIREEGLTEKLIDIFSKSPDMDSARIEKISSGLQERIRKFKKFTSKKVRSIEKQGKKKDVSR